MSEDEAFKCVGTRVEMLDAGSMDWVEGLLISCQPFYSDQCPSCERGPGWLNPQVRTSAFALEADDGRTLQGPAGWIREKGADE